MQPGLDGDGDRLLGLGPSAADLAWVDPALADPCVDHAARFTFDAAYDGTGNWPFNTAYAAHFGLDAFVTRLRSLQEAELFLAAGIPLVASIAAGPGELDGFPLPQGTAGHLVVIVGFTADGRPGRQRSRGGVERRCPPQLRPGAVRARLARGLGRSGLRDHPARDGAAAVSRQLVGDGPQRTSNVARIPRARWSARVHHTA